jgi:hypothetical protein
MATRAAEVTARFSDVVERQPTGPDIESVRQALIASWRQREVAELSPGGLRLSPWVALDPQFELAGDEEFVTAYVARLKSRATARSVAAAMQAWLTLYPEPLAATWRRLLDSLLRNHSSQRLARWRERADDVGFLRYDGTERLARSIIEGRRSPETLKELGQAAAYLRATAREVLELIRQLLVSRQISALELERGLSWLKGKCIARHAAECLLLPFVRENPEAAIQKVIKVALVSVLGDPRIQRGAWATVQPEARMVLARWLAGESLDLFFGLLDKTAKDAHWRYRRAFWESYYKDEYILDAWVVLGRDARSHARRLSLIDPAAAGRLKGGQTSQSVLLLRLGGLVISEWSHDGCCWIWREDAKAPRFYEAEYAAEKLKGRAAEIYSGDSWRYAKSSPVGIRHSAASQFQWQTHVSQLIRDRTGIGMPTSRFRPR